MRLEDLKNRLSMALANARKLDTEFAKGVAYAYDIILSILDDVEGVIQWHPFPQEKPQRDDIYLISVNGQNRTDTGYWFGDEGCWSNEDAVSIGCDDWLAYAHVLAWAEYPRPYMEEDK